MCSAFFWKRFSETLKKQIGNLCAFGCETKPRIVQNKRKKPLENVSRNYFQTEEKRSCLTLLTCKKRFNLPILFLTIKVTRSARNELSYFGTHCNPKQTIPKRPSWLGMIDPVMKAYNLVNATQKA